VYPSTQTLFGQVAHAKQLPKLQEKAKEVHIQLETRGRRSEIGDGAPAGGPAATSGYFSVGAGEDWRRNQTGLDGRGFG